MMMMSKSAAIFAILILLGVSTSAVTDYEGYDGCQETKGCFGFPNNCVESADCQVLVTYSRVSGDDQFAFEISHVHGAGTGRGKYAALAFSEDAAMGQDLVFACVGGQSLFIGWNEGKRATTTLSTNLAKSMTFISDNGLNICKFRLDAKLNFVVGATNQQKRVDLSGGGNHLLVAIGAGTANRIGYHESRAASGSPVAFDSFSAVGASDNILLRAHGVLMVLAWLFFVPVAAMMPRYFKGRWDQQVCGEPAWQGWFVVHALMVLSGALLSGLAVALAFGQVGADPFLSISHNPHAVIGTIALVFMLAQLPMAALRPHPDHPNRSVRG